MAQETATLEYLQKNVWWWKWPDAEMKLRSVLWDKHTKEAARNYEIMRRFPKAETLRKSYLELNGHERTLIHCLWCNWPKNPYRFATERSQFDENGWTPVFQNPPVQWNLNLANNILVSEFERQIDLAREIQKIEEPPSLQGRKNRGASWLYIEILDRQKHGIGTFSDGERKMRNKGMQMAEQFFAEFDSALAKNLYALRQVSQVVPLKAKPRPKRSAVFPLVSLDDTSKILTTSEYFNFQIIDPFH